MNLYRAQTTTFKQQDAHFKTNHRAWGDSRRLEVHDPVSNPNTARAPAS